MAQIDSLLNTVSAESIDSIVITSSSSPDGPVWTNEKLSKRRAEEMKLYFTRKYPRVSGNKIHSYSIGENWEGLTAAVEGDPKVPSKERVLYILRNTKDKEIMENRLRGLYGGVPFRYVFDNLMPGLRNVSTCVVWYSEPVEDVPVETPKEEAAANPPAEIETVVVEEATATEETATVTEAEETIEEDKTPLLEAKREKPLFAIKTNVLYDLALMPDIEGEYYFSDHWSAGLEFQIAWWTFSNKDRFYQLWQINPEVRYWLRGDGYHTGHYFGASVAGGAYDLKRDVTGYKGEYVTAGLSWGYLLPIKGRMALEMGLTMGYLHTEYEKYDRYDPMGKHYKYISTNKTSYFGPTEAKVSLTWRFGDKNKQ